MKLRILLAGIAAGVVYFLLGWIIYGMLAADFFANNVGSATGVMKTNEEMCLLSIFIGNLGWGFLLAVIFGYWGKVKSAVDGLMKGFVIGILMAMGYDLMMYGTSNIMNMTAAIVDIIIGGVMSGIAGLVVGLILKTKSAASE